MVIKHRHTGLTLMVIDDLQGANLRGADLRWADLREANLQEADLQGADLRGADLRWAILRRVDLQEADSRGAKLQGANLLVLTLPFYTAYVQKEYTRIGCEYFSNEQWCNFDDETISKMDKNALEFWNSYKSVIFSAMESLQRI